MTEKISAEDKQFLKKTFALASKGAGTVSPNPLVGALIVKKGIIISTGYHKAAGKKHAEIIAIDKAGVKAKDGTLYVNLEPCVHRGRTGPCCDAIISAGIKRVVFSGRDPNPLVNGKGGKRLADAGIEVSQGILKEEAEELNEIFFKFITTGKPFVIMKSAASLDGKIAVPSGESKWITGIESRRFVHKLRASADAVLIGSNTLKKDNPLLDCRLFKSKRTPTAVIADTKLTSNPDSLVFKSEDRRRVIIATADSDANRRKAKRFLNIGVEIMFCKKDKKHIDLEDLIKRLGKEKITSLLIEGGGEINASALAKGIVDKIYLFLSPILIGGNRAKGFTGSEGVKSISSAYKMGIIKIKRTGPDILIIGKMFKRKKPR